VLVLRRWDARHADARSSDPRLECYAEGGEAVIEIFEYVVWFISKIVDLLGGEARK
jgi:hypothetical protein